MAAGFRRHHSRGRQLALPLSLKSELAGDIADPDQSGAAASSVRGPQRGRFRKQQRRQERLQKKQRRALYNDRLRKKKPQSKEAPANHDSAGEYDEVVDENVPMSDDHGDSTDEGDQSELKIRSLPSTTTSSYKRFRSSMNDLGQEIADLERKLGTDYDKLRRELDDDGLLDLYDAVDGVLGSQAGGDDITSAFDMDSDQAEARAEEFRQKAEIRRHKQAHLYGVGPDQHDPDDDGAVTAAAPGLYRPPALRESGAEIHVRKGLMRTVVGQLNRLTNSNLEPTLNAIKVLFESHPRGVLIDIICESILQLVGAFETTSPPVAIPLAGLVTALNVQIGLELGAVFCERLARAFQTAYQSHIQNKNDVDDDDNSSRRRRRVLNLARMLAHLHVFQMVSSAMVYDLIRMFIATFTELDIDLILALVGTCGAQMRRDDPGALKAIVIQIQGRTTGLDAAPGSRTAFVLDLIYDLKNNRARQAPGQLDALRAWLRQRYPDTDRVQVRVGWEDLLNSDKTGRWWLVGSAWKGRASATFSGEKSTADRIQDTVNEATAGAADLLRLAKARRMNTDVRRAVFCVVMGADDYLDACEKLARLSLRAPADKEVVAVVLDCVAHEKAWNPYYGHLAAKLCSYQRSYKFTFQLAFCDLYKTMSNGSWTPRQLSNIAHLLAHLVTEFYISLAHLKSVDLLALDADGTLFFLVLFKAVLRSPNPVLGGVFQRISASSKLEPVRDAIRLFLRLHLSGQADLQQQIAFAQHCMDRTDFLETL